MIYKSHISLINNSDETQADPHYKYYGRGKGYDKGRRYYYDRYV